MIAHCPKCGTQHVLLTLVACCLRCGILFWSDGRYVEMQGIVETPETDPSAEHAETML